MSEDPNASQENREDDILGITSDGVNLSCWRIGRLWQLAAALPVEAVPLSSFSELLNETSTLSNGELAHKAARIMAADLSYPVIFSAKGWLFDGAHRIMKAYALGLTEIKAVRFTEDPEPDYVRQITSS